MVRGGSWNNNPQNLRAANRNRNTTDNRNNNIGFRVARTAPRQSGSFYEAARSAGGCSEAVGTLAVPAALLPALGLGAQRLVSLHWRGRFVEPQRTNSFTIS